MVANPPQKKSSEKGEKKIYFFLYSNRDPPELNSAQGVRDTVYGEPFDDGWPGVGDELFIDQVYLD